MGETTYCLERAKSGRSKCKKCKTAIAKGELRIGVSNPGPGDIMMTSWYLPSCMVIGRKLKAQGIQNFEDFIRSGLLEDNTDDNILADGDEVVKLIESVARNADSSSKQKASKDGKSPVKKENSGDLDHVSSVIAKIKEVALALQEEEDADISPPKKKVKVEKVKVEKKIKKTQYSEEERMKAKIYLNHYFDKTNEALKDILRWNHQPVTGKKDLLLCRLLDGHYSNARLSRCPTCGQGRLKLDEKNTNQALCNGYFDEDLQLRKSCFYVCPIDKAPRLGPWYVEEPTEDEKKQMEEQLENAKGGASGLDGDNKELEGLSKKVKELDWNLSNVAGIKKAANDILKIVWKELDLPDNEKKARMAVGKVVIANKNKSAEEMLQLIVEQFGFVSVKKTQSESKTKTLTTMCGHKANVSIMEAILELGECYFKEGNSNAGATYKKVANAIMGLDFEIDESNAKSLGKGKTKVAGIGKGSADKIHEFITTGKIGKLEEKLAS